MSAQNQNQKQTYTEWTKKQYNDQYERWMPWIEDNVLYYFTKDNKASYATKDQLNKTKVTGVDQVDNLQDGVNNLVAGQVGQGGLLQPAGDAISKEGINRAERGGKDDEGSYGGPLGGVTDAPVNAAKQGGSSVASGAQTGASKVTEGAKGAGGYLGSFWGGKKEEKK